MAKNKVQARQPIAELEDLRDDCIAIMLNSGLSLKRVHEKGGPTPQTSSKWLYKITRFPQLATIRAFLNACEHDLVITSKNHTEVKRIGYGGISMPPRPARKRITRHTVRR